MINIRSFRDLLRLLFIFRREVKMTVVATFVVVLLGALLLGAAILSRAVAPGVKMSDQRPSFSLETAIPQAFGEWRLDNTLVPLQVDPETQSRLNKIYNQTLSRTYVNPRGERVMLSIAYAATRATT